MARDFRRQLDSSQNFAANSPVSFDLPRDSVYKEILLRLEASFSTGVAEALSGEWESAPWTLIKRIELVADGKDTIKSYDGATLIDINYFDFGTWPYNPELTLGASADTGDFEMLGIISLESVGMMRPQNTWLDARKLSSLELRITFGAGLADVYNTVTGGAIDTYRLTPYGHEILDIAPESTFSVNQEAMNQFSFPTNTATQRRFKLNVGNAYRRVLISTRDSNARAVVNRMQAFRLVENGTFNRRFWPAGLLKNFNSRRAGRNFGLGSGPSGMPTLVATGANAGFRDSVYNLDIAEDGSEAALLDTRAFSDLSIECDWNGANITDLIRFTPQIWLPNLR